MTMPETQHPKNQTDAPRTHDLVKPGSTIDPKKGSAAQPPQQAGNQQQGQPDPSGKNDTYGQNLPGETDMERMRREDPLFIEKTKPEDPSGRPGQLTRDNVNPNIPSAKPEDARVINPGGIVDPTSLGMEQGGVAPKYPDIGGSINEPHAEAGSDPRVADLPPGHGNSSVNEPPGSNVGGEGGSEGGGEGEATAPTIEALDPDEIEIGSADVVLHVHGTGFTPESIIHFAGYDEPTSFVNDTEVTTGLKPSLWQAADVVECTVKNGDQESEPVEFEFLEADVPAATRQTKRTKPKPPGKGKGKKKK
jgi:hypothetical protein